MTGPVRAVRPAGELLVRALKAASDTKLLCIERGAVKQVPEAFRSQFGNRPAIVVADTTTFEVAGKSTFDSLRGNGIAVDEPVILTGPDIHAEWKYIQQLDAALLRTEAIPVAVGSGTINDLTKLAAHHAKRPYMSVPTAASMDGYTAFGASITREGSKQTFSCPAPRAVVADLDVICAAPPDMTASGYADLAAKLTAGADWIVADVMGVEPIDELSWQMVQEPLRFWLGAPEAIRNGDTDAFGRLIEGLMMGGFAMQHHKSSRPASGAEHQFSHLWDMQHHTYRGVAPSHGFKVGIGTVASAALYEALYDLPLETLNVDEAIAEFPDLPQAERNIIASLGSGELGQKAIEETRSKHIGNDELRRQLERLREQWPALRERLRAHLPTIHEIRQMLDAAGAPTDSAQIGISAARLRESYTQAWSIRRRYTVLDLAARAGVLDLCLDKIFAQPIGSSGSNAQ